MNKNKGFTLIELLVVIAIIGILASVVLASLSSARDKGKDAAVKSQLASLKAQAELYYAKGETYLGVCSGIQTDNGFGGTAGPGLFNAAYKSSGSAGTIASPSTNDDDVNGGLVATCNDASESWVVEVPLSTSADSKPVMYCSDNTGLSKEVTKTLTASSTACPTS